MQEIVRLRSFVQHTAELDTTNGKSGKVNEYSYEPRHNFGRGVAASLWPKQQKHHAHAPKNKHQEWKRGEEGKAFRHWTNLIAQDDQ
jgi:hypothetical protein